MSSEVKDLLKKLLNKDPKMRISSLQVLSHQWFNRFMGDSYLLSMQPKLTVDESRQIIKSICRYYAQPNLKKLAFMQISKFSNSMTTFYIRF